jgi:hypothetical protein
MACSDDKVLNPRTNRCIKIGGSVFKQLLEDTAVTFSAEDKQKILNAGFTLKTPKIVPPKVSPPKTITSPGLELKTDVSKKNIRKVEQHVISVINNEKYIDEGHKTYCKNNNTKALKVPLTKYTVSYQIPYSVSPIAKLTSFQRYLDDKTLTFVKGFNKNIEINFNNYNKSTSLGLFANQDYEIDHDWFYEMDNYITNLSVRDAYTVLGYSNNSFNFINKYLLGLMKTHLDMITDTVWSTKNYFPFYIQAFHLLDEVGLINDVVVDISNKKLKVSEWCKHIQAVGAKEGYEYFIHVMKYFTFSFWEKTMKIFKDDFKRIISNAPPLKNKMNVYRGVTNDYFLKGAKDNYYKNTCFVSTSLDPRFALLYLREQQCCFKRITLLPGSKVLFISGLSLYPDELEIVINVDSTLYITESKLVDVYAENYIGTYDVCFRNTAPINISDMVLVESPVAIQTIQEIQEEIKGLHAQMMKAMQSKNVSLIRELTTKIADLQKKAESLEKENKIKYPDFLQKFVDSKTGKLPKLPTIDGPVEITDVIKSENQLIVVDDLPYDIKSLFDLIQTDISQGNVWGINPYVKDEGLVLSFDKNVKPLILAEGKKRKILPMSAKWIDHTPASADDKQLRGHYILEEKTTPTQWLSKGWASDGTAFPTNKYYSVTFEFPNKKVRQSPGKTAIFPLTKKTLQFINQKLIPVYQAGALWSRKTSITDKIEVINPNIHLIFEDNEPQRWYKGKIESLEEEILKFAPAFV